MVIDYSNGMLYVCDTGNQRILRINLGVIGKSLDPYGENIEGYYSMEGAEFETIIDSGLVSPTNDIYNEFLWLVIMQLVK